MTTDADLASLREALTHVEAPCTPVDVGPAGRLHGWSFVPVEAYQVAWGDARVSVLLDVVDEGASASFTCLEGGEPHGGGPGLLPCAEAVASRTAQLLTEGGSWVRVEPLDRD